MVSRVFIAIAALLLPAAAAAQDPGTIKLLSKNEVVTVDFAGAEEKFARVTNEASAKYLIVGPVTAQIDYRLHLPPDWSEGPESFLIVSLANAPYKKFKVVPKLSATEEQFPALENLKPSAPVGFYLPLGPGAHVVEFRGQLGELSGASIQVIDSKEAVRKLAEPPPDPPTTTTRAGDDDDDTLVVTNTTTTTTTATTTETDTTTTLDALETVGKGRLEQRAWGVGAYSGAMLPIGDDQKLGGSYGAFFHRRIAAGIGLQAAVGFGHFQESRPGNPGTGLSPTVISFQYVPMTLSLVVHLPLQTRFMPYLCAGGGGLYTTSVFEQIQLTTREETFGFVGTGALGMEIDLSRDFDGSAEGARKVLVQLGGAFASADFEAHTTDTVTALQLSVGGVLRW